MSFSGNMDSAVITYNNLGNPISLIRARVNTGAPNQIFRYDKNNRLTDMIGAYENGTYELWHHFTYKNKPGTNKNLPVTDSIYVFGNISDGPLPEPDYIELRSVDFTYDNYGRIVQVINKGIIPCYPGEATSYTYNNAGNLTSAGYAYDNKINFHRTHPIWQFIDRDYSVNNAYNQTTYTEYGLPTAVNLPGHSVFYYGFSGEIEIFYDCQHSTHK